MRWTRLPLVQKEQNEQEREKEQHKVSLHVLPRLHANSIGQQATCVFECRACTVCSVR